MPTSIRRFSSSILTTSCKFYPYHPQKGGDFLGALAIYKATPSLIHEELLTSGIKEATALSLIEEFTSQKGIQSLADVHYCDVIDFHKKVTQTSSLSQSQRRHFASALETAIRLFYGNIDELDDLGFERPIHNKLSFFMTINQVWHVLDITAELRRDYEFYLTEIGIARPLSYVKAMDKAKLSAISASKNDFGPKILRYDNRLLYLAYHPDYAIAERFSFTQNKTPLFFDFSADAPLLLKRQIFSYLKTVLETKCHLSSHMLIQTQITPLWNLYNFCMQEKIEDLTRIRKIQSDGYKTYCKSLPNKPTTMDLSIISSLRKHLFLGSPVIDWDASVWFLERFSFTEGRVNPARPFEAFHFDDIKSQDNLSLFKAYMKYLLGQSNRLSITTIYGHYSTVRNFLHYLDGKKLNLTDLTKSDLENYIECGRETEVKAATKNRALDHLAKFISYLEIKEFIAPLGFRFERYRSIPVLTHNDYSVSTDDQDKIFQVLSEFPENLRLMFLNLWCVGLRLNEVCCIKGNAYVKDGSVCWLLIYQNKAKREKRVPIPAELYDMMSAYIQNHEIGPNDYVFPAINGKGAYRATTFVTQINHLLDSFGISESYHFRSHGYRHTLATELYMDGANIQCIREYLGHVSENMTRQYIDYLPSRIDEMNDAYFISKGKTNQSHLLQEKTNESVF